MIKLNFQRYEQNVQLVQAYAADDNADTSSYSFTYKGFKLLNRLKILYLGSALYKITKIPV